MPLGSKVAPTRGTLHVFPTDLEFSCVAMYSYPRYKENKSEILFKRHTSEGAKTGTTVYSLNDLLLCNMVLRSKDCHNEVIITSLQGS